MAVTTFLPLAKVRRRDDARPRDEGAVKFLADSMRESGQLMPILVRPVGDEFELIAGSHRLAAAEVLDWPDIEARFAEHDDDLHAELAMIDENLCRAELSPSESATQLARRKAIYQSLYPETRNGSNQHTRVRQIGEGSLPNENKPVERFTTSAAAATGRSERSVQRDTERGEKLCADAVAVIRNTKLDTGTYIDKIKNLPPNDQVQAAKRDLAISNKADRAEKSAKKPAPASSPEPEPSPSDAHEKLIAALDLLDGVVVADVVKDCPPRMRAALCQRASSAIDLLSDVMENVSR